MNKSTGFPSVSVLFSNACVQCTLVLLATMKDGLSSLYYPLVLLPYALVLYGADCIFLRRERTLSQLALLNAGICLAAFLSSVLLGKLHTIGSAAVAGAFCIWLAVRAGQLAMKKPVLADLILSMDFALVILALFTAALSAMELPNVWCMPIAGGCAASILGLIVFRSGTRLNSKSWTFLAAAFSGIFALVWLLVSFVAAPASEGLMTLWRWLVTAVKFLLSILWKILFFLASLIPVSEDG